MSLEFIMIILAVFIAGSYYIHFGLESEITRLREKFLDYKISKNQENIKFIDIISDLQDQVNDMKLTEAEKKALKKAEKIKEKLG